ncbi:MULTISPECIES: peptidylprolyl isomerase [Caulobacter]|jgi:peptidylprolyl isomerase|uniref:Peptidyl-prolyl cis-trans isomerase n=1 Tax=Caulobacter vibrioides OR37 TaxID=1292034 RepID=R0EHA4_CAUVI|nr:MULTISPECIES: peptidylprolyl isomerase [Caulobacter]ENZ81424.1 peptidyl-prolyl cis-trans isomerase (rotamase) - cyclophilin family [Caulobacter vibrioides OR37]MBQ1560677.1 peptidylprolyl isomerase [Caulobacter sp.]
MKLATTAAALALAAAATSFGAASAQTVPAASDWRTPDPNNVIVVETNKGRIIAELYPEAAPNHVERVRSLVKSGFYNGLTFFRVIGDFMAQTGDPQNTGMGGSDQPNLTAEFTFRRGADMPLAEGFKVGTNEAGWWKSLPVTSQNSALAVMTADRKVATWGNFCSGVLGMARAGDPDSANSQFFFMRQANASLDKTYTAFGRVLSGLDVVRAIKTGEPVPDPQDKMISVKLLADLPADKRPSIQVMDTRSAAFKALVVKRQGEMGGGFTNCDVDVPVQVK